MTDKSTFRFEKDMRPIVLQWLRRSGYLTGEFELYLCGGNIDIAAARYGPRPGKRRKPPLIEMVAVELKLHDFAGVLLQAKANRAGCHLSYMAMPQQRCEMMREQTKQKARDAGVGLLSVNDAVSVLIEPVRGGEPHARTVAALWRHLRGEYATNPDPTPD